MLTNWPLWPAVGHVVRDPPSFDDYRFRVTLTPNSEDWGCSLLQASIEMQCSY